MAIDGYAVDFKPEGHHIVTQHTDKPGIVGKVGTILGEADVNIAGMYLGRAGKYGHAVMALSVDGPAPESVLAQIAALDGMEVVRQIEL